MLRIGRYIQPATATCISISAELGSYRCGTIYRVVYRRDRDGSDRREFRKILFDSTAK